MHLSPPFSIYGTTTLASAETQHCNGRRATIIGTQGADTIRGTAAADVIVGLGGNDTISGSGGNDVICGGKGNDRLRGNAGNDVIKGGPGDDTIGDSSLIESGDDRLFGGPGADKIQGGRGDDSVFGGAGVDSLDGDSEKDILHGGKDRDLLDPGDGPGSDYAYGDDGPDRIVQNSGSTVYMFGGAGQDILDGRAVPTGVTVADGGSDVDYIYVNDGRPFDVIYGESWDKCAYDESFDDVFGC